MNENIEVGSLYHLSGDIQNGSYIDHEDVTRIVKYVTDTHVVCVCGRRFIRNENLKMELIKDFI